MINYDIRILIEIVRNLWLVYQDLMETASKLNHLSWKLQSWIFKHPFLSLHLSCLPMFPKYCAGKTMLMMRYTICWLRRRRKKGMMLTNWRRRHKRTHRRRPTMHRPTQTETLPENDNTDPPLPAASHHRQDYRRCRRWHQPWIRHAVKSSGTPMWFLSNRRPLLSQKRCLYIQRRLKICGNRSDHPCSN